MLLKGTTEQIAQVDAILRQLDSSKSESQPNRRRIARISIRTAISAMVLGHGLHVPIKLFSRNISTSGIGFVSRRFCRLGELLALGFHLPGHTPKLVLAQITFSRYVRAGMYEMGAEFIDCAVGSEDRDLPPAWLHRSDNAATESATNQGTDARADSKTGGKAGMKGAEAGGKAAEAAPQETADAAGSLELPQV